MVESRYFLNDFRSSIFPLFYYELLLVAFKAFGSLTFYIRVS